MTDVKEDKKVNNATLGSDLRNLPFEVRNECILYSLYTRELALKYIGCLTEHTRVVIQNS